jgi:hypothetical protein
MSNNELIYTTTFKAYHLDIESSRIQLSQSAWIEKSDEYINQPSNFSPSFIWSFDDPQFGLSRFSKQLIASAVRLRTVHTASEADTIQFQIHNCSHIAIASAILCKPWFVVGIETFENNRDNNSGIGPEMSLFVGEKSAKPAYIPSSMESILIRIYNFVYRSIALSSWDSDDAKLLLLFLRCVLRTPYQRFTVLKLSLDHLFSEWHATILNAAIFFEYLFTNKSEDYQKGIQKWNIIFQSSALVDEELIDKVFRFRHLVAHSNPTRAKKIIEDWKNQSGFDDLKMADVIRETIWSTAKTCMYAIIENNALYQRFQKERPN